MLVKRKSILSGKETTLDLPITLEQLANWHKGVLVQDAFPHLTPEQREFIVSGIMDVEWDNEFAEDDYD